jgi:hypothetical protein
MTARLASSILVSALIRQAESAGGFGAVVARGDATAGAIVVILTERGAEQRLYERLLQPDGSYAWQQTYSQDVDNKGEFQSHLDRRRRYDPDLWILELDIPRLERFAAEMTAAN